MDDKLLEKDVLDELEWEPSLDAAAIQATVVGDKVRLEGKVRAWFERDVAERAAWGAPRVQAVEDRVASGA